jgi:1,4-dihydroxy-2-naphthoate octaprenyltransferase
LQLGNKLDISWPGIKKSYVGWMRALRIFSLGIALHSCLLGVVFAITQDFHFDSPYFLLHSLLVVVSGIALQAGVNLINDFYEYKNKHLENKLSDLQLDERQERFIHLLVFVTGLAAFGITIPVGIYLTIYFGWELLILGIIGFFGGYFYTAEPFNYKRRGLAVVFVFFLMGHLMIQGSYFAVSGQFSLELLAFGTSVSLLVSAILLSNEIRDFEADTHFKIKTLSVRLGLNNARLLLFVLLGLSYIAATISSVFLTQSVPLWLLIPLPFLIPIVKYSYKKNRKKLVLWMMLHHLLFGAMVMLDLLV